MKNLNNESIRVLALNLGMSDIDLTDCYNQLFECSVASPCYRHVTQEQAGKLMTELAKQADSRDNDRNRRH